MNVCTAPGQPGTNISAEAKRAFNALTSGEYDNFVLYSCFCNGEPTSAICALSRCEDTGDYIIAPLFVARTPGMRLTNHEGAEA